MTTDPVIRFLREGFLASPLLRDLTRAAQQDPYPESAAKRHHLVSRFLLARFADPDRDRERIVQLDVRTGTPHAVPPVTAASQERYYRLTDDDGTVHQRLEYFLSKVEDHAAPVIDLLCRQPAELRAPDRATLSYFVALLEDRTIGGLDRLGDFAETLLVSLLADRTADTDTFVADYQRAFGEADLATIERFRKDVLDSLARGEVGLGNPKEVAVDLMLRHAEDASQYIYQLQWLLLRAPEGGLITSDRGLAMSDPTPPYPWSGHAILSSGNAQTTIPLDPHHCLMLTVPAEPVVDPGVLMEDIDQEQVARLNLRTYGFAHRFVFGRSQADVQRVRIDAKARPRLVERPRPPRYVVLIDADPSDERLAHEHRRRGWPPYLMYEGQRHDYVVLDRDDNPIERSVDLAQLGKSRAVRRLGTSQVVERTISPHPLDLRPG